MFDEEEDNYARGTRPNQQVYDNSISISSNGVGDMVRQLLGGPLRVLGATVLPIGPGGRAGAPSPEERNEKKMLVLLNTMISAAEAKRQQRSTPEESSEHPDVLPVGKTLIHVRDYRELERTSSGQAVLKMLHNIVQGRRQNGERILILGTSSAEEDVSAYSRSGVRALQTRSDDSLERTIIIPAMSGDVSNEIFRFDRNSRVREVNIRHLRDVIRRRSGEDGESVTLVVPKNWHFTVEEKDAISGISDSIWNFDYVHRVASIALGRLESSAELTIADIAAATSIIERSDNVKYDWAQKEYQSMKTRMEQEEGAATEGVVETAKSKIEKITKTCNNHEKKLLGGVIDPDSIKSGFSSVRAAPETIDARKPSLPFP